LFSNFKNEKSKSESSCTVTGPSISIVLELINFSGKLETTELFDGFK